MCVSVGFRVAYVTGLESYCPPPCGLGMEARASTLPLSCISKSFLNYLYSLQTRNIPFYNRRGILSRRKTRKHLPSSSSSPLASENPQAEHGRKPSPAQLARPGCRPRGSPSASSFPDTWNSHPGQLPRFCFWARQCKAHTFPLSLPW